MRRPTLAPGWNLAWRTGRPRSTTWPWRSWWRPSSSILNQDNLSARANYHLGLVLLAIDRAGLAVNALREALRLGWKDAAVHLALGQALTGQGKFEEAIAAYHEALHLAPGAIEAHAGLGLALEGAGRVDEAIAQYELYLQSLQSASGADEHSVEAITH